MTVLCALAGIVLILDVWVESFEALVLPRRVTRPFRFNRFYFRNFWRLWTWAAKLLSPGRNRQNLLSVFGPFSLLALFSLWVVFLIVGFGFLHHALGQTQTLADAMYLSGVTLTTLGYGDMTPGNRATRIVSVVEAANGFGFFAITIAYLPVLYAAFSRRETLIALLDARAGSPPAAGRLLQRLPPGSENKDVLHRFLVDAETWSAELLEAQLSFPVLGYYRSQHDNQSWLAGIICILDTSALLLTVTECAERDQARLTFAMARHALVDLALVLRRPPALKGADRLPPERLKELLSALGAQGVKIRDDPKVTARLAEMRKLYEPFAEALGKYFLLVLPEVWPAEERPDNWQTSAWMRRASPITALGADPRDDHFD